MWRLLYEQVFFFFFSFFGLEIESQPTNAKNKTQEKEYAHNKGRWDPSNVPHHHIWSESTQKLSLTKDNLHSTQARTTRTPQTEDKPQATNRQSTKVCCYF